MGVQFDHPLLLLLLIPLVFGARYAYRSDFRLLGGRKKWAIGLRITIVTLLILLLAGLRTYTLVKDKEVVFLSDRSASMRESSSVSAWMMKASEGKEPKDSIGAVSLGLDAVVEKIWTHLFSPKGRLVARSILVLLIWRKVFSLQQAYLVGKVTDMWCSFQMGKKI